MQTENVTVLKQQVLGGDYRVLKLASGKIAAKIKPGQFIHLRVAERSDPVLRRPFSVFKADQHSLTILYKVVGKGTGLLAGLKVGDRISIIGPLGNGFPIPGHKVDPVLITGGYGSAALYLLAERAEKKGTIFMGGETAADILCVNDFKRLGWNVRIATENGSAGEKGLVTDILTEYFSKGSNRRQIALYACGPMGMLKAVSEIAIAGGWKAWLSLDRHMGCGVGACLACVQKIKVDDGQSPTSGWKWARICTEGPVFECREIIWD
ncbi:MAG: dihydroorotate dehydrogenase electron transfer subunit [Kiritimatiellia bacterium]|nr:dihydroorotate dehydrogenase electron transfer subunit [Kiritimatiellia bacterium]